MMHKQGGTPDDSDGIRHVGRVEMLVASRKKKLVAISISAATIAILLLSAAYWLAGRGTTIQRELSAASQLLPQLKDEVVNDESEAAARTVERLKSHTAAAREATRDPLWNLAAALPWMGGNFRAATEISTGVDDVVRLGAEPLVKVFRSLNWKELVPSSNGADVASLEKARPQLVSAAHAIRASAARLDSISTDGLLPQIAGPLVESREQLSKLRTGMDAAADMSIVAPDMLGVYGTRRYLLLVQNNAESRATGGIPGALATLTIKNGKASLDAQSSAGRMGIFVPPIAVDPDQQLIYSSRLGRFMQDVNLTPDFPTAASTAKAMWVERTGQNIDGVLSIDPVALAYILEATGPVPVGERGGLTFPDGDLPQELSSRNVVATVLSDVYAEIGDTAQQDAYFANVAMTIFEALSSGTGDPKNLVEGLSRAAGERRILLWSADPRLQSVIHKYAVSGSIAGPSIMPAEFGVYFNDGTGAKMDYHVKRTVQLITECPADGYAQIKVRITTTNTAPKDAATSLPEYVTGGGAFGVAMGTVQTNIVAYGPVQSNVENAAADGRKISFASQLHSGRPVGTVTVVLPPGKSSTVDFTFGKIVQHAEPKLSVTPTVQPLKEVILQTMSEKCPPVG